MGKWNQFGLKHLKHLVFFLTVGVCFLTGCSKVSENYKTAMGLCEEGKYTEAETYFKDALKEDETEPDYYIGYGMALNHLLKYEEAEDLFSKILETEDKMSDGEKKQIYYGQTIALYGQGKYGEVLPLTEKALKIKDFSDLDRNLRYTGAVSGFMSGNEEKAEELCEKLLEKDDSDMEVYLLYGEMKKASGDTDGAIRIYEKAIGKDKSYFDAYFGLYQCYLEAGQSSAASELLGQMTSLEAKEASGMIAVGKAWYYKEEYEKALTFFEKAYQKDADGLFYMALTQKTLGKTEEAEKEFLSYISEKKEELIPEVYNQLAGIYMEREQYEKAQVMISQGLAFGDTKATQNLLKNQVILLELQGEYDKALEAAKEYKKVFPEDAAMKKEISFIKTRKK